MPNPILAFVEKYAGSRLAQQATGILQDFWKDTPATFPVYELKLAGKTIRIPNLLKPQPLAPGQAATAPKATSSKSNATLWHAAPGELEEKMWGAEQIYPAANEVMRMLTAPADLGQGKAVIDLTAGLGGATRKLAEHIGQVKGMEMDSDIAFRGMEISTKTGKSKTVPIEVYDPNSFSVPSIHDCIVARELFYRIADREKFFYSIAAGLKAGGSVVFTDYIVNPEDRQKAAITGWQAQEVGAKPLGLIEMAEAWAKAGLELKESEDQTPFYRKEISNGINRFVAALQAAGPADAATKKAILKEVETWVLRLGAIQQGMKFYRFRAVKS